MADTALFPSDERDKLTLRLQNAVNGFVDAPRGAVEEVDSVLEDTIARLTDTLAKRRRTLRTSWQSTPARGEEPRGTGTPAPAAAPGEAAAPAHGRAAGVAPGGALPTEGDAHAEAATTDTEQLRLALRDYRETAERLLRL